ncbi:MAG: hypothetical protein JNM70_05020 [Anaerolineae bacterium]|nr:hypothetical protein [Anaerolineae bacterium]
MSAIWTCQFSCSDDASTVADLLRRSLTDLGYTLYNPFGLLPGKAYPQTIRLFAAPSRGGWVRILGEAEAALLCQLSQTTLVLQASLRDGQSQINVYVNGAAADPLEALSAHLRPGQTREHLRAALAGEGLPPALTASPPGSKALPLDALPPDVREMAGRVDAGQANRMFARLSGDLMKRVSGESQAAAAQALVSGANLPDWESAGGRMIRAVLGCLTIPEGWQEPDFDALRDAYPLLERRRRRPDAPLLPGDDALMSRVPDALDYIPVYGGKG